LFSEDTIQYLKSVDQKAGMTQQLEYVHQGKPVDASAYDVVHLTLPQAYRCIERSSRSRFVVTIHDCTHRKFPQFHLEDNIKAAEGGIQFALARGARFITNSETTRREFLTEYEVDPSHVSVTPLAVDRSRFSRVVDPLASERIRAKYGIPEAPFLLALSTLEPRKNLINTARAFVSFRRQYPEDETSLVIAGREGWKFGDLLSDQSARDDRIFFTGYVEDEDLPLIYSSAVALLFVSHYEGFGLPALEGMSCGLPVIFGGGALPEVVGEAGLPANPNSVDDIQRRIAEISLRPGLRQRLSLKALARAEDFSWAETTRKTLEVYRADC
jgi:glycosyltransferase involved in cell wall biosynthesis